MPKTVLVLDVDKTLADFGHREHLLRSFCVICGSEGKTLCQHCGYDGFSTPLASWKAFTNPALLHLDGAIPAAQQVVAQFRKLGADVHFITGRRQQARAVTQEWLTKHYGFNSNTDKLVMRESYNYDDVSVKDAPASIFKEKAFQRLKEMCSYSGNEFFIFADDDEQVLPMYSRFGIAMKAPECWSLLVHKQPSKSESLFAK